MVDNAHCATDIPGSATRKLSHHNEEKLIAV
jgi:hypothetical protein